MSAKSIILLSFMVCGMANAAAECVTSTSPEMSVPGDKVSKQVKKQAKQFVKQGWKPMPGGIPIEEQLERSMLYAAEQDGNVSRYCLGEATAKGQNINAVRKQAEAMARTEVAKQMHSQVETEVKISVEAGTMSSEQGQQVLTMLATNRTKVNQMLGHTRTIMSMYRQIGDLVEVTVRVALDVRDTRQAVNSLIEEMK